MGDRIIMGKDLGEILEIKAMREIAGGQMIGNLEALVTVDQGQVLDQVPMEIELHVLSVESMITSQETAQ